MDLIRIVDLLLASARLAFRLASEFVSALSLLMLALWVGRQFDSGWRLSGADTTLLWLALLAALGRMALRRVFPPAAKAEEPPRRMPEPWYGRTCGACSTTVSDRNMRRERRAGSLWVVLTCDCGKTRLSRRVGDG